MLLAHPTKYGAGITLAGDFVDLRSLHETIHYLAAEDGPLPSCHDEYVLALAYDIRHAYQGDRRTEPSGYAYDDTPYFCVDILWPDFLMQLGMLRAAAGFMPTDKNHQANLYRLEACAESALLAFDAATGMRCIAWLKRFGALPADFLLEFVSQQTYGYLFGSSTGKARFRRLPDLLETISPVTPQYQKFDKEVRAQAVEEGCEPQALGDSREWPQFKW